MKKLLCILLGSGALILSGCQSHLGDQFTTLHQPQKDEALVYFYRPASFIGGAISYDINEKDKKITSMYNGGYNYYSTKSGEKTYWAKTEAKDEISLNTENGRIYFVKAGISMGILMGRPKLSLVPPETALQEIKECKIVLSDGE